MMVKGACIKKSLFLLFIMAITETLIAQHEHHLSGGNKIPEQDTSWKHSSMMSHENPGNMSHAFSLNLPMSCNGSGTGWLADDIRL